MITNVLPFADRVVSVGTFPSYKEQVTWVKPGHAAQRAEHKRQSALELTGTSRMVALMAAARWQSIADAQTRSPQSPEVQ